MIALLSSILFFSLTTNTSAIYNPSLYTNNRFGIHIADTSDLSGVAKLVNSSGGDWGYVTFVIQKGERDPKRWQQVFDQMRRLHLIPIIRIATAPVGFGNNTWEKPTTDEIDGWVSFLNSLNWVIQNRYVVIGNEPNHAEEWGGELDPAGYETYLKTFSEKLKTANNNFFIMAAGFDASAPNSKTAMDEALYLSQMFQADPQAFSYIDGWASHSYPNPAFMGPPEASGKGTVRTFNWEINYLKFLGLKKDLPVFITETGWIHDQDTTATDLGPKFESAFKDAWNDPKIVAITPFIYKYVGKPFDNFSWINKDGVPYDFYTNVANLAKIKGAPLQDYKADVLTGIFPKIATINSLYNGVLVVKNTGESIWAKDNIYILTTNNEPLEIKSIYPQSVEPGQIAVFLVEGKFPGSAGLYSTNIELGNQGKIFNSNFTLSANLIPGVPSLNDILNYLKITLARRIGNYFHLNL